MSTTGCLRKCVAVGCLSLLFFSGCGVNKESAEQASGGAAGKSKSGPEQNPSSESASSVSLPTAAIGRGGKLGQEVIRRPKLEKGSAEWIVQEIILLRRKPLPQTDDVEALRAARRERNQTIIKMASEAISLAHFDPEKEEVFNEAVHQMMEARLQSALQGNREDIDALYEDAASLHQRAPKSKAAAEAAFALARFAHTNARRFAKQEPRWLEEFARQARQFAANYPHEDSRAVSLLYSAAWSCELHQMIDEAIGCYTLIRDEFPKSPQAQQVGAVLRRLQLKGKPLELAGPTIDGGFVDIDEQRGKVVLVVFWATEAKRFLEQLPQLLSASDKYKHSDFSMIGVSLDDEETAVEAFVEKHNLAWPQIFYTDRKKRRWDNPIVKYYGIRDIPMLWLVDQNGVVVNTLVEPAKLTDELQQLLSRQPR